MEVLHSQLAALIAQCTFTQLAEVYVALAGGACFLASRALRSNR